MNEIDRSLVVIAATQRQVFTRAQALAAGLSLDALYRRTKHGLYVPCGPHTFYFAGATLDYRGELQAGILDLGDGALVSGRAAAALHGLDGFQEGPRAYLVPRSMRRRRTSGRVSSARVIGPLDRVTVDGLPVTSGTLTIIQLLGDATERELGNAIDSATRGGLTAPIVLRRRLQELGRRGRAGVAMFDKVMDSAGVESWLEREFLKLVRRAGLPVPKAQCIYRRDGRHVARVDFDFEPAPVVVEVGGRRGYMAAEERRRKEHRRNELQLLGKTVYFFTTEDVAEDGLYVLETLRAALGLTA